MFKKIIFSLFLVAFVLHGATAGTITSDDLVNHLKHAVESSLKEERVTKLNCDLSYGCFKNRHYYFETSIKRTRDDAAAFCKQINMELLNVEDCEENAFVSNMIKDNECYKNNFWTSGYHTGNWFWGNGVPMTYTNWMKAEPNFGKNQYCVAYSANYVQWSDEVCSNKYFFVCESNNKCQ